jgi:aromatic ring-cleaving dioxygenase
MGDVSKIWGYHAHVYFVDETSDAALRIREELPRRFRVELGRMLPALGPHPTPFFVASFGLDQFDKVVPWLMLNREGLSILVHPRTGTVGANIGEHELADHTAHAAWLGTPLSLDEKLL